MRSWILAVATLALFSCEDAQNPPTIVSIDPPNGSELSGKCPIRVQFSESLESAVVKVDGSLVESLKPAVVWKTTALEDDTAEFYPPGGEWTEGAGSFAFSVNEPFGNPVSETLSYRVVDEPDELWRRDEAHRTGAFVQGTFIGLVFVDAQTGFAITESASAFKTTDGGATWTQVAELPPHEWAGVWAANASKVWLLSALGELASTTDGGETWTVVDKKRELSPLRNSFLQFAGIDETTLFIAGKGAILRSTDAGETWETVAEEDTFVSFYFPSPDDLWALTYAGEVHHSVDRGATWTQTATGLPTGLKILTGDGAGKLWAAGIEETIVASDDGVTWTVQHTDTEGEILFGVVATDALHAWAAGVLGSVWRTEDGGATWARTQSTLPRDLTTLTHNGAGELWVAGAQGHLASSTDGETWTQRTGGNSERLLSIWASDAERVTAVGEHGTLLTTANGGASWTRHDLGTDSFLMDVWATGAERWVAALDGTIHYSKDDGANWEERSAVPMPPAAIFGGDASHLWVAGGLCPGTSTEIYRSTDGGNTWEPTHLNGIRCVHDLWATDANHVWAAAEKGQALSSIGVVLRSTDGGATWTTAELEEGYLYGLWGADESNLWAVGRRRMGVEVEPWVARSRDGGKTWSREYKIGGGIWQDVFAPTPELAWGVGSGLVYGEVFSTDDACHVPAMEPNPGWEQLEAVHGTPDGKRVWVVGQDGLIARLDRP